MNENIRALKKQLNTISELAIYLNKQTENRKNGNGCNEELFYILRYKSNEIKNSIIDTQNLEDVIKIDSLCKISIKIDELQKNKSHLSLLCELKEEKKT